MGDRTAEFRFWRFSCPEGQIKVEEHRVWYLPESRIGIVEQRHAAEVPDVVATAEVSQA